MGSASKLQEGPRESVQRSAGSLDATRHTWANTRILEAASRALKRWQDRSPNEVFEPRDFPTVSDVRSRWELYHLFDHST